MLFFFSVDGNVSVSELNRKWVKERDKERVPAKRKADCGGVVFRRL